MKKKNSLRRILTIIALIIFMLCAVILGLRFRSERKAVEKEQEISELYHHPAESVGTDREESETQEAATETKAPLGDMDFAQLKEINSHIVGWLTVGERIDAPVVKYDNDYYLNHDFYGNPDSNGTLFVNESNRMQPVDDILLIHGHNMRSGTAFGTLKKFEDYSYLTQYPVVGFRTIYDDSDVYYTPIAAFNASMDPSDPEYFDITQINFADDEDSSSGGLFGSKARKSTDFQNYLNAMSAWSLWQPKVDVTPDDKLIMLVTCSYYQTDGRLMLVCRKLRKGESPDKIRALYAQ